MKKYKSEAQWKTRSKKAIHIVASTLTQLKCKSCGFVFNNGDKCKECKSTNFIVPTEVERKYYVFNLENTMINPNKLVIEYICFP